MMNRIAHSNVGDFFVHTSKRVSAVLSESSCSSTSARLNAAVFYDFWKRHCGELESNL